MRISTSRWPIIRPVELPGLLIATEQVHRAAQYLAMAGKFLLKNQPDDSHTNMGWDMSREALLSHSLPDGHQLMLETTKMQLTLLLGPSSIATFSLIGQTRKAGVAWIKKTLAAAEIPAHDYAIDLHYDIPEHEIDRGATFRELSTGEYESFSRVRTLGHVAMTAWAASFEHASTIRTWPHHFDIGTYIPLVLDSEGAPEKSITLGLAIPDQYVDEYYFYITHWSKAGGISYESLAELPGCGFWNEKDFTGAMLRLSDLLAHEGSKEQIDHFSVFMNEGIRASIELLGLDPAIYLD